ncbi:hypothetical protein BD408DRAFT_412017 [Parasitella parasitica]|nr:hypothetical protein BD408DRAFT_412017 [Parasitella parasitica]
MAYQTSTFKSNGPPPSYNLDEEKNGLTYIDNKRLQAICSEQEDLSAVPQVPSKKQRNGSHESASDDQRRVGCLSLFWFAVICDIAATVVALLGTMGATLKCRSSCGDVCDGCNNKSRKGLIASLVIFVILSIFIAVFRLICYCCSRSNTTHTELSPNK